MSLSKLERDLLDFFEGHAEQAFRAGDLAALFEMTSNRQYKRLVKALNFLENHGDLHINQRGQYQWRPSQRRVIGTYRANAKGFGFITYDEHLTDLFVPQGDHGNALNGDTVEAEIIKEVDPQTGKGSLAKIIKVVERASQQVVGEFVGFDSDERQQTGYLGYLIPQGEFSKDLRVFVLPDGIHPAASSICIAEIKSYPSREYPQRIEVLITKEIGHKDEPGVDILSILYQFNIPHEFPEEVKREAEAIPQEIQAENLQGRLDLRDQLIITIDGASAKDIDDAISLEKLGPDTYRLGVHIADVAHYVQEGSAINREALDRGTSVYLTDRVVPMLPQRLSNGICSLLPHEERLAVSCIMDINGQGKVIKHQLALSVIESSYRMTYDDVNAMIEGQSEVIDQYQEIATMVEQMVEVHQILEQMRRERGALDFDAKEAEIVVDDQGHPTEILLRERETAERLIESFMLVANETIAADYQAKHLPFLYRIHEQPDEERMDRFAEFVTAFGIILRGNTANITPKQLQKMLVSIKGEPYETVVSMMMLRSMQQAKYSEEPLGHYGLATRDYTHFTAPIRRYPDLLVHRLIHLYLSGKLTAKERQRWEEKIPGIAEHTSKMERRAVDAERETEALKKAEYMEDKIGQEFDGIITSVTNFGIFVSLANTVEGLIKLSDLKGDYYKFHQEHMMLIGERTGKVFRIGQAVRIEVEHVDVEEREIDFKLIDAEVVEGIAVYPVKQIRDRGGRSRSDQRKRNKKTEKKPMAKKKKKFKIRKRK
ncbi:RNAse R [Ignavigranum ruoffiae]|uniref:Ribonuclease R n=1 Tax=Ignavigranum ruoffiae TaxID=89093 RepID=A0A1H9ARF6_9LACT|nr:ribonuclease R [Ignavigranum ruoffiae]SEP79111.1 RNAse R [Ignavigranum ruoffiae]